MHSHHSPTSSVTTNSPSPASTSRTTPSPPCSSSSPPDELVELSRVGARETAVQDERSHRTVPCAQCRRIRRVCRWVEGERSCERCLKKGGECSGPQPRSKIRLDDFLEDLVSAVKIEELDDSEGGEQQVIDIGPTSTSARWMRTHQGYALNHHLVETTLQYTHTIAFLGVDLESFKERFYGQSGRMTEMSANHELLALGFMVLGMQITGHTAIVGAHPPPSGLSMVGLQRQASLAGLFEVIVDRAQSHVPLPPADAVDRIALLLMALDYLHLPEYGSLRHLLLGETVVFGMRLLEDFSLPADLRETAQGYLQELARKEIRQSLERGTPSILSPTEHHQLLALPSSPLQPHVPSDEELSLLFQFDEADLPPTFQAFGKLYYAFFGSLEPVYDHLDYVLAYAPRDRLEKAIEYIWHRLDELARHFDREFDRVFHDPRHAQLSTPRLTIRPAAFAGSIMQHEVQNLALLWCCQLALANAKVGREYIERGEKHIYSELSRFARRLRHLPAIPDQDIGNHLVIAQVALTLDLYRRSYLLPWSLEYPKEREMLLGGLRLGSPTLPEAARLVLLLETGDPRWTQCAPRTHTPTRRHRSPLTRLSMSDVVISSATFHRRASHVFDLWEAKEEDTAPLNDVDYLLVVAGNSDEENPYRKGSALQTYLLGYEFPSTLMLLGKRKVWFVVSGQKAKHLQPITTGEGDKKVEVEILTRSKDEAENKKLFEQIIQTIGDGNKVGTLPKDKMAGKFVTEWQNVLAGSGSDLKELDVALGVSALLAVKDAEELQNERNAATMTNKLMSHFSNAMAGYIDAGKKVTHEKLGEEIEGKLEDNKFWKGLKLGDGFETGFGDWCYSPIIQSGGNYDLKSSAQTDDQRLKPGVILCSLGIRYKSYCSNVGRTFMIDPTSEQEKNYLFVVELQKFALSELREGAVCKDVYQKIVDKIQADRPDLVQHFAKTAGFGMGLEFRDAAYPLTVKGTRKVKADMIFSLTLGFNNIPDSKGSVYAVSLVDTVQVGKEGSKILADGMKGKDDIMFYLEDEEKKPNKSAQSKDAPSRRNAAPTAVVKSKLRNENRDIDADALNRRKQHQRELATRRQEEGLEKYSGEGNGGGNNREKQWRRFESYVKDSQLPEAVSGQKIVVDARRLTIILPINGFAVPFHVNALKSLIKQEEGEYTVLRFMFTTPGAITGKKEDTPFEDPNATFIRGITYRSTDSFRFAELHKEINDLKKAAVKRENERKELADVVEQDKLVELKGRRPIKLTEVQLRPSFDGKRQAGDVEIHSNGIRYQSSVKSEQKLDILFSNIKHLLFQPCDNELIVVLHIHLKSPIMIGKKKAKDVQFFREVSDASFDETGNKKRKRNYHDEDELEAEQEERKRRADLNKYFKAFSDKIAEASNGRVEVDIPFRELGFQGVPFRSNVLLQPTTETLVFLTEPPFLVLTLAEIEIAHLERVQYGLKNFDLVFVFQDFTRAPVHINTIPSNQLDSVKEWLDSVDIPFSEGPVNLNWQAIMKTVNDDPYDFYKEGGWSFLQQKDDEPGSSGESEDESEFEAASDDFEESEEDSGSDFSDASESESGSGEDFSDSGEDWSDAENRLAEKEKRGARGRSVSSDDARGKKSKGKSAPAKSKPKGRK